MRRGEIEEAAGAFVAQQEWAHGEGVGPGMAPFGEDDVDHLGGQSGLDLGQVANFVLPNRRAAQFAVHDGQGQARRDVQKADASTAVQL